MTRQLYPGRPTRFRETAYSDHAWKTAIPSNSVSARLPPEFEAFLNHNDKGVTASIPAGTYSKRRAEQFGDCGGGVAFWPPDEATVRSLDSTELSSATDGTKNGPSCRSDRLMESKLRDAMLASDMKRLDALLTDDLVFTNQTGQRLTKADDLAAHNSGRLKLTKIDISDQLVRPSESFAIVTLVACVGGSFDGQNFSGSFAYTRVWANTDGRWKVAAAHCSTVT